MRKEKEKDKDKQATISSFFKTNQAPASTSTASTSTNAKKRIESITLDDSSDEEVQPAPITKKAKVSHPPTAESSSSHFPPSAGPVASTSALPPAPAPAASTSSKQPKKTSAAERVAQWRFDPSASSGPPPPITEAQRARHDLFATKLLARKPRNRLGYLEKDHYLAATSDNGSGMEVDHDGGSDAEEDEDDEEEQEVVKGKGKGKAPAKGSGSVKYTPLEQQVIALKKANPGILLMIENGYKYAFYDDDARIASRTLGIACFPKKHMLTASIPNHRLNIHIKKLINSGHKVGVVTQQETAALKKTSDNKSGPFTRALSAVYTSATFIDELNVDNSLGDDPTGRSSSAPSTLLCLVEDSLTKSDKSEGGASKVRFGMIAVMPSTGEVIFDDFEDSHMRSELETRMLHLQPSELILPKSLSKPTEGILSYLTHQSPGVDGVSSCRIERITKKLTNDSAFSFVSDFYTTEATRKQKLKGKGKQNEVDEIVIDDDSEDDDLASGAILETLPKTAVLALAFLIKHLKSFNLDTVFLHTHSFAHFSSRSVMTLNGNTLANLEILRNETDYKEKGSLLSILDHCQTPFGRRLLRRWVARPLVSLPAVNERLDAITEILDTSSSSSSILLKLNQIFKKLPDLERGLVRIHFGRAKPEELLRVLEALERVSSVFYGPPEDDESGEGEERDVEAILLKRVVRELPKIKDAVEGLLGELDRGLTKSGKKEDMFVDTTGETFEGIRNVKDRLAAAEDSLQEELVKCRKLLKLPKLEYVQVSQEEFLIPVPVAQKKMVPDNWLRINATKAVQRFRSPGIQKQLLELEQCRELLAAEADKAYKGFLQRVSEHYESFRAAINHIAIADCLLSLSIVATLPGYCRPDFSPDPGTLKILGGRHPMVEAVLPSPFVPNDVIIGEDTYRQLILTGLNMGGKSSLSRSVALIALMAQIGSYVPADSCTSSIFDGIYTRMGASDDLARGRSTFMVELSETSDILKLATPRSLVILDELGRGTSTNDGQAIAGAVLEHVVDKINCVTIFVTHFPDLARIAQKRPKSVSVAHMSCLETPSTTHGFPEIVFLYKLVPGLAARSHGIHVARLAELPDRVLDMAKKKAQELEKEMGERKLKRRMERTEGLLRALKVGDEESAKRFGGEFVDEGEVGV